MLALGHRVSYGILLPLNNHLPQDERMIMRITPGSRKYSECKACFALARPLMSTPNGWNDIHSNAKIEVQYWQNRANAMYRQKRINSIKILAASEAGQKTNESIPSTDISYNVPITPNFEVHRGSRIPTGQLRYCRRQNSH